MDVDFFGKIGGVGIDVIVFGGWLECFCGFLGLEICEVFNIKIFLFFIVGEVLFCMVDVLEFICVVFIFGGFFVL